jgi:hypothetical protein
MFVFVVCYIVHVVLDYVCACFAFVVYFLILGRKKSVSFFFF